MMHLLHSTFTAVGGASSCIKALRTQTLFLTLLVVALTAMTAAAHPAGRIITVSRDTAISYRDADGCFNYILQPNDQRTRNVWRKATGARLRAGRSYLHSPIDVTRRDSAALDSLLAVEQQSAVRLVHHLRHPWLYFLLGVAIYFSGWWLWRWTRFRWRSRK